MTKTIADEYGHCVICHKNMLIQEVIGGKVEERFTPDYIEKEFLLSDKSKMRVALCKDCKVRTTDSDNDSIMNSVIEGWRVQVGNLPWTDNVKKSHMDKYSKLKIVTASEGMPQDILDRKFKEYKEKNK